MTTPPVPAFPGGSWGTHLPPCHLCWRQIVDFSIFSFVTCSPPLSMFHGAVFQWNMATPCLTMLYRHACPSVSRLTPCPPANRRGLAEGSDGDRRFSAEVFLHEGTHSSLRHMLLHVQGPAGQCTRNCPLHWEPKHTCASCTVLLASWW